MRAMTSRTVYHRLLLYGVNMPGNLIPEYLVDAVKYITKQCNNENHNTLHVNNVCDLRGTIQTIQVLNCLTVITVLLCPLWHYNKNLSLWPCHQKNAQALWVGKTSFRILLLSFYGQNNVSTAPADLRA